MATIEELDFELKIKDNNFDTKIEQLKQKATEFNTEVSKLLEVSSKLSKTTKKNSDVATVAHMEMVEYAKSIGKTSDALKSLNKYYKQQEKESNAAEKAKLRASKEAAREQMRLIKERERAEKQAVKEAIRLAKERERAELKASREAERAAKKAAAEAAKAHKEEIALLSKKYNHYNNLRKELTFQSSLYRQLKTLALAYFSVQAVRGFVTELIKVSSEFEKQRVALGSIIDDTIKAGSLFNKLQSLAVKSPFSFGELTSYLKQLSAFSIPTNELYNTTKMLADVSSGLGIDMSRIVLAYGQVASAEFLRGQEIRQFTEAGLPILKELAKQFSVIYDRAVSVGEVFDLVSKRKVPFEMVKQVFIDLTSEGGKFYKMQEVLADTLSGKIANLKDAYQLMLYEIGKGNSETMNDAVDGLRYLIEHWEDVGRVLSVIIKTYGAYKALQIVETIYREVTALKALKAATTAAEAAQLGLNMATKASIWGLVAAGIVFATSALVEWIDKLTEATPAEKRAADAMSEFNNETIKLKVGAKTLIDELSELTAGTEEYEEKRRRLITNYGEYLTKVDVEKIKIGELTGVYESLSSAIEKSVKARVSAYARENALSALAKDESDILDKANKYFKRFEISAETRAEVLRYLSKPEMQLYEIDAKAFEELKNNDRTWAGRFNKFEELHNLRAKRLQEYKKEIEDIDNLWGEAVKEEDSAVNRLVYNEEQSGGSGTNPRIKQIEQMIELLRKFKEAIAELKSLGVDNAEGMLVSIFPQHEALINIQDADAEIQKLISELQTLGTDGEEVAKKIKDSISDEKYKQFTANLKEVESAMKKAADTALKAGKDFQEGLEKFNPTTELEGVGLEFDISNTVRTYKDGLKKIGQEYSKLLKTIEQGDSKESGGRIIALGSAKQERTLNEWQKFLDKMNELGEKGFEEIKDGFGIPDGEISKLNPFQRLNLGRRLKEMLSKEFDPNMPELAAVRQQLIGQGLDGNELDSTLESYFNGRKKRALKYQEQLQTSKMKSSQQIVGYAAKGLNELTSAMKQYAEASGNSKMKEGAEILGGISELAQGFATGGPWGVLAAGVKLAMQTVAQEMAYMARLESLIEKAKHNAQLLKWDEQMDTDTIFGVNKVKQMREATNVMGEISQKYKELYNTLEHQNITKDSIQGLMTAFTSLQLPFQGLFKAASEARKQMDAYNEAVAKGYSGLEAYIVKFNDRGGLANWFGFSDDYMNLKDLIEGLGYEMYDRYGNLNADALQAILDTYERLGDEDRTWMEEAIGYSQKYEEAMEKINEVMQDLYGGYVSDIVDSMIDKWISLGAVTADYAEALSDVAKNYAKMAIQSAILENVFTEDFEDKLREATINQNAQEVMHLFEQAQSQIEDMTPFIAQILDYLDQYFVNEDSSDSLSNGIKSITEETATLLASYINAIRADVSVTRGNVQVISNDVKAIMGLLPSAPSLAEYLTQIQANTYNTQVATEGILGELRSVIGTETGMTAVRVAM